TGWLYTSTRYAAAKAVRSDLRWHAREKKANAMDEFASPDPIETDWEQLRPVIDEAMHQLRERDRNAVLLRYFEGRPLSEVGARMGLSEDAARKQVGRGLDRLRTLLARRGVIYSGTALTGLLLAQTVAAAPPSGAALQIAGTALGIAAAGGGSTLTLIKVITM